MSRTVLRSRRVLVDGVERALDVVLLGERIEQLASHGAQYPSGTEIIDCGEQIVMPSLVDAHVHCNDPGRSHWEGFEAATRAGAAGGIGWLADMPLNSDPVTTSVAALEAKRRAADGRLYVDVSLYGGLIGGAAQVADRAALEALAGRTSGIKAFLCDSGLEDFPPVRSADLEFAMPILRARGRRLLLHAELVEPREPQAEAPHASRYADYLATRPAGFEEAAVRAAIELAERTECGLHIVHVSAASTVALLAAAKQRGVDVTAETCPHYLYFAAEEIPEGRPEFKCAPPIRSAHHREALWQGLIEGTLDFIASDHSPCPPAMKWPTRALPSSDPGTECDWMSAWGGIASLQLLLPVVYTASRCRHVSVARLLEWLSLAPARFLGGQRGIAIGSRADIVVWDPDASFEVRGDQLEHRHELTPYQGERLFGRVQRHYLRGEPVFTRSEVCAEARGQIVLADRHVEAGDSDSMTVQQLDPLDDIAAWELLQRCCGARRWLETMMASRPFGDPEALALASRQAFEGLEERDWLEAFAAHPKIGDREGATANGADSAAALLAASEQASTALASADTLARLAQRNLEYERRFGFIYIVFASGKSSEQMLALLEQRLANDRVTEIQNASREQAKITARRLQELFGVSPGF
jgi:allantoinase